MSFHLWAMEMRLKIVEASAKHDFGLRGSSEWSAHLKTNSLLGETHGD